MEDLGLKDISVEGTKGYGTFDYIPEPTEGSAGDPAAEAATAGIVNTDASAELAQQVPNIVVPVNQSSDSDSDRDIDTNTTAGITTLNTGNLGKYITKDRAISYGLSQVHPLLGLAYTTYKYFNPGMDQAIVDEAETARLADTPENIGGQIDFETGEITGSRTGDVNIYDEVALTGGSTDDSTPTYTAPAPAPAPGPVFYDYTSGGDSGSSDSGYQGDDSDQEQSDGGRGSRYAVGGIVRLRKNKQNTRIHDRRKRLAMGGITSLHG